MTTRRWILIAAFGLAAAAGGCAKTVPSPLPEPDLEEGPPRRASWTSDRADLRQGDIVTVVVDERTTARERVSRLGSDQRSSKAAFDAKLDSGDSKDQYSFGLDSRLNNDSRETGSADRQGDLVGVVTARVLAVDASGTGLIQGSKAVVIDGREQRITVRGLVRPSDLSTDNVVYSSRLADASISYTGNKIGPKRGIVGKVLAALWPF